MDADREEVMRYAGPTPAPRLTATQVAPAAVVKTYPSLMVTGGSVPDIQFGLDQQMLAIDTYHFVAGLEGYSPQLIRHDSPDSSVVILGQAGVTS